MSSRRYKMKIFALDIGGTNLKFGLFDENFALLSEGEVPSKAALGAEELLKVLFSVCDKQKNKGGFDLIGVSTAGMVALDGSIAYANENIPRYTGVKLKELLQNRYGVPAFVLNDIAAGALAEPNEGGGDFYYLSLGTGVGGIMVKNGLPLSGEQGIAGQIGYLPSIGGRGIVDKSASVSALSKLLNIRVADAFEKAEQGDQTYASIISDWAKEVMHVLTMVVGFYNPPCIVIGGGVSRQGERLVRRLMLEINEMPFPYRRALTLKTAKNPSGIIGAAKFAKLKSEEALK